MSKTGSRGKQAVKQMAGSPEVAKQVQDQLDRESVAVAKLNQTISGSYTQAEVQAISTKVDAIIQALKDAGLMA